MCTRCKILFCKVQVGTPVQVVYVLYVGTVVYWFISILTTQ